MVEELEGGPTIVEGFYDSEYELPCEFTQLEDGLYCVPRRDMRGTFKGYADSKCQIRLLQAEEDCQPTNLLRQAVGVCSSPEVVYEYEQGTADVAAFDLTASGTCEATGEVVPAAIARVGVAVDPKRFVRGVERIVPTTNGRLGLRVIEAEDGAYAPLQLVDTQLGFPCRNVPQHERCEPVSAASLTNIFTDAACMNPGQIGASSRRPECGEVEWIRDSTPGATVEFFRADGEFKGDAWGQRTVQQTKECVARPDTGYSYEVGAPLMTALITPASVRLGGGRVQAVGLGEGADPLYLDPFRLWDTDRAEDCSAVKVDGVTLCVPLDRPSFDSDALQYADSACREPLVQCRTGNCEQTYWYKLASLCTGSDLFSSIVRALQPVTASVYQRDATGDCVGPVAADRAWTWEVVPVEESGLARVTETILP
jgi:hypothetical protein